MEEKGKSFVNIFDSKIKVNIFAKVCDFDSLFS